mmetsp:Transcript_40963/g.47621  ORF Transcript_40963/g.47621 Transcript_40963/m.47621 type:complete len:80 (+) Transcript_40963:76-315(+)
MVATDRAIGQRWHIIVTSCFVYWLVWVGVMPFVDASHFTQAWFMHREYGILIPAIIVTLLALMSLTTASIHIIRGSSTS